MASVGLTLAAAAVLLIPLALYVMLRVQADGPPGLREPATEAAQPVAKQETKFKRAFAEFGTEGETPKAKARPSAMSATLVPQPPRLPVRPLPTPANVRLGMEKTRLIADFGRPNMITTEVNEGQALETFHYLQPEAGTETVVLLSSGKVVGASSTSY